jgi:hypothetical protein
MERSTGSFGSGEDWNRNSRVAVNSEERLRPAFGSGEFKSC